jgi:uncharacterized protein YqgC (DUF456 family)
MEAQEKPSYLSYAIQIGAIMAVVSTALTYASMYRFIGQPPAGSMFGIAQIVPLITCIIAGFGGMLVVRNFAKETQLAMKAGQGAVIGLVTGAIITLFMVVLGQVWTQLIDPTLMDRFADATIANFEAIPNLPDEQRTAMVDAAYQQFQDQKSFMGIVKASLMSFVALGVVNLITGIIGVSIFAKKEEVL